jgi:2-keto-3-deoxy-L-rhamnonate aldolase RhmA
MAETDPEGYFVLSQVENARCLSLLKHIFRVRTLPTIFAGPQDRGSLACFLLKHEKLANRFWALIEIPPVSLDAKRSSPRDF